jgi:hypothetical protein
MLRLVIMLVATTWVAIVAPARAYDIAAHATITRRALPQSRLAEILKSLGFEKGLSHEFFNRGLPESVVEAIAQGAMSEDEPDTRVVNHFHNPLVPKWVDAGFSAFGIQPGQSSVVWQQNPRQEPGWGGSSGTWSWPRARKLYFDALTSRDELERNNAFVGLFRSLGQVMHLVQDASVPAHTRNDAHLVKSVLGVDFFDPDRYERWVDTLKPSELGSYLNRPAIRPSERVFSRIGTAPRVNRAAAPSPVSGLIDTAQYDGSNPDVTATPADGRPAVGLAEFSNANFFSNDTLFAADIPGGSAPFPSPPARA